MKPLQFVVQSRRNTNYYKCDRLTRIRLTSYLLRVGAALLAALSSNPNDISARHSLDVVRRLIEAQRSLTDWDEFHVESFVSGIWTSGKRNTIPLNLVSEDDGVRYDDVRRVNPEVIEIAAARTARLPIDVVGSILQYGSEPIGSPQDASKASVAGTPAVTRTNAPENQVLNDLVEMLIARVDALEVQLGSAIGEQSHGDHQRSSVEMGKMNGTSGSVSVTNHGLKCLVEKANARRAASLNVNQPH